MERFKFKDSEGIEISCYKWIPDSDKIKGIVQISHGMTETALRYSEFAERLNEAGYIVYAHDHRGHGSTAKSKEELGYIADDDGFNWMVKDIKELTDIIKKQNKNHKIILFGHSMGSFLSQSYIENYGEEIDALILSGTNGKPKAYTKFGIVISKIEMKLRGRKAKSNLMDKLSFGNFNSKFENPRTGYDWLCSVPEEVDKYMNDELCGFICTTSYYYDLVKGLWKIHDIENLNKIPKNLPIYIFAGDKDPVGYEGRGIVNLYNTYKNIKIEDVEYKLYKDGRHEMLNEKDKNIVMDDIIKWIDKKVI
ncbi:MAG: lysophospholipase [Clostridium sp.]